MRFLVHIPDGFIDVSTSAAAGVVAAGGVAASVRSGARELADRQIPFAGLAAAFIFALQMLNFPVAAGTSGHLLGGALAAILLGPAMGVTVVTIVVVVQALMFADGGVSALGLNVFNMAIVTALVGWLVFRAITAILPKRRPVALVATMAAAWASVVVSSVAFVAEYAVGGRGGVDVGTVFGAMVGVHGLIGIGEGIITGTVIAAVLAVRPDLVRGFEVAGIRAGGAAVGRRAVGAFVAAGLAAAVALVVFVAPLASSDPDGLQRVAIDQGFAATEEAHAVGGPLAGYGVGGVESDAVGTAVAGSVGVVATFAVGLILASTIRRRRKAMTPHESVT